MNKFNTADRVLCIVFLLFLIILGLRIVFPHSLILDFLLFVAEAALVGGIADWFAVTALFKKPLGFPFHTAILPRRRKQFINSCIKMLQTEFLSKKKIYKRICNADLLSKGLVWLRQPANKAYLVHTVMQFIIEKIKTLGTAACPPYHIAVVIGGTSAEKNLLTVKLASTHYYDNLPTTGNEYGRAFRDIELEKEVLKEVHNIGLGAQFGGKYLAHDIRIIRLPRHGASCPVGLGVSCSADRNIKCKINKEGIWIEKLDSHPGELIPAELREAGEGDAVRINLNQPMADILKELDKYPVATRLSLNGTIIVGRDIAHAKLKERLDRGEDLPQYIKDHPIYYAGPAKTPKGMACGSMGPTTAGRMDPYVDLFQSHGGSMIMLAKGNRSQQVTDACKKHGGFYLGSIGGPAAILAQNNIKSIECLEYPELGMEAIWKIEVEDFPAFILVDNKGNDFFKQIKPRCTCSK